ncbi:putative membrane protein [Microbacteriaceae bacterium SG_E_30_P1]|uniref:Membrane protein n=1 Tax=Antiquaquibacter oligotrophicus TaxID=2880260 RepID=A0ABT6KS06_9MICO|nr:small multi-drug export protein [Antiquaquibacter oligotrophicus]MDH6182273.1 putative membrane protein [Antiquaquibacter oligotrophicus]UDF12070.1 small multi-drug export protein [Antiquaquibacter oligotrophicus]
MLEALQNFTEGLPAALQWLGVILLGAIPFVESYLGSVIGVLAGLSPFVAIPAAIVGNIISMLVFVLSAHRVRERVTRDSEKVLSPRRQKLKERFDRFGVPGVSLLGQLVLPSQITSAAIVSFGASRNAVILWQTISIVLWGVVCGTLAAVGVNLFAGR